MAVFRTATPTANAALDQYNVALNAGGGPGLLKFYTGTQPETADDALSGNTLLGTLTFSDPAASAASARTLTFSTITEDSAADVSGQATFARAQDSNGTTVFDADVGDAVNNPTAIILMNSRDFVVGGPIRVTSFTITLPA
jgi:hypothetical protein